MLLHNNVSSNCHCREDKFHGYVVSSQSSLMGCFWKEKMWLEFNPLSQNTVCKVICGFLHLTRTTGWWSLFLQCHKIDQVFFELLCYKQMWLVLTFYSFITKMRAAFSVHTLSPTKKEQFKFLLLTIWLKNWEKFEFLFVQYHQQNESSLGFVFVYYHYVSNCLHWYTFINKLWTLLSPNKEDLCFRAYTVSTKWEHFEFLLSPSHQQWERSLGFCSYAVINKIRQSEFMFMHCFNSMRAIVCIDTLFSVCTLLSSNQEDCVSVLTKYQQNEDSLSFCSHLLNNSVREVWVSFPTLSSTKWEQSGFMFICYHQHYESSCLYFYTISEKMRAVVSIRTLSSPNEEDLCFWAYVVSTKWKQWLLLLQILRKQKYSTDATSVFKVKLKAEWYNTR